MVDYNALEMETMKKRFFAHMSNENFGNPALKKQLKYQKTDNNVLLSRKQWLMYPKANFALKHQYIKNRNVCFNFYMSPSCSQIKHWFVSGKKKTWESLAEHLTALRKIAPAISIHFRVFKTLPIFKIFSSLVSPGFLFITSVVSYSHPYMN